MSRYTGPREKKERRLGERLGLKGERSQSPKAAVLRRPYPPGQHGPTYRPRKPSEFSLQLRSKQKVRYMYGLVEKTFRAYVKKALDQRKESPYVAVLRALETRLDNVVFRMGVGQSRSQARQLVSHGHITVNGKRAKTASIVTRVGDVIAVRERSNALPFFTTQLPRWFEKSITPSWLTVDKQAISATVKGAPVADESGIQPSDLQAIIEYYSR